MTSLFSVCVRSLGLAVKSRIAYRFDFIFSIFVIIIFDIVSPFVMILIYHNGAEIPGWGLYEILLLSGVFMMSQGIVFSLFFGIIWNILYRIQSGTFDLLLIKPRSILIMSIVTGFDIDSSGNFFAGLLVFIFAMLHLPQPEAVQWFCFVLLFVLSIMTLFSFSLFMSGSLFIWQGNDRIIELYTSVSTFGGYPISIFPKGLQSLITFIIPIAITGFFPASILLNRNIDGLAFSIIACFLFFILSLFFWHKILSRYSSAGG